MKKRLGIYIHIPFCSVKCDYCNFYSLAGRDELMPAYEAALVRHIGEHATLLDGFDIDTVYFGGGTPGYFGADRLGRILGAVRTTDASEHILPGAETAGERILRDAHTASGRVLPDAHTVSGRVLPDAHTALGRILSDAEITVEVNPGSASGAGLEKLRRAGFNRLSVGVQCADDRLLKLIGRRHTFADAEHTIRSARDAGFNNISVDVIYGLPEQSMDSWVETLDKAIALNAEHISCYGLKIEEGTRLYAQKDSPAVPSDETQADMYLYTVETLAQHGYTQYEISNFAREGYESKHNLKYWLGGSYLGFGPAAHSYIGKQRFSFITDVALYIEKVNSGVNVTDYSEDITASQGAAEYLMLRLRTTTGISPEEFGGLTGMSTESIEQMQELFAKYEANGLASKTNRRWRFTPKGFLVSNVLIGQLLDACCMDL